MAKWANTWKCFVAILIVSLVTVSVLDHLFLDHLLVIQQRTDHFFVQFSTLWGTKNGHRLRPGLSLGPARYSVPHWMKFRADAEELLYILRNQVPANCKDLKKGSFSCTNIRCFLSCFRWSHVFLLISARFFPGVMKVDCLFCENGRSRRSYGLIWSCFASSWTNQVSNISMKSWSFSGLFQGISLSEQLKLHGFLHLGTTMKQFSPSHQTPK